MSLQSPRLRQYRSMTAFCFVCNLPILSHQVGLEWHGGNGWDDIVRVQVEESTLNQRLGTGRRDSATQITQPGEIQESSPTNQRRRRSSIAQLTDILLGRGGTGTSTKTTRSNKLRRRQTLADIGKLMPWSRQATTESNNVTKFWSKRDVSQPQQAPTVISPTPRRGSADLKSSRRGSGESIRGRRDSTTIGQTSKKHNCSRHRRRQSQQSVDSGGITPTKYYRSDQRPSIFSTDSAASNTIRDHPESRQSFDRSSSTETRNEGKIMTPTATTATSMMTDGRPPINDIRVVNAMTTTSTNTASTLSVDGKFTREKNLSLESSITPAIVMSSVTPPAISPTASGILPVLGTSTSGSSSPVGSPNVSSTPTHSLLSTRRDSTTQCYYKGKEVSPNKSSRLKRQEATIEQPMPSTGQRESQPTLSSDADDGGRKARRDSLSPDSATHPRRRDSRSHLSSDRTVDKKDVSPIKQRQAHLRRQSAAMAGRPPRSPESSSCSSREPSPCARAPRKGHTAQIQKQSTTDEIFIARGFRRQSTTEEMIRCRNFRRQSSQSDDTVQRYRGRRDSSAQILDGTFASMTVETSSTFFDSSTQTEPLPLYDNNHYHEECLRCNSCHVNLTGHNHKRARRFKNRILCDLHFADVALMECSDFMQQLRSFKQHSLGCAVARRKSSTTLIFPLPPQACADEFCAESLHNLIPTPGYWIECSRQQVTPEALWDESKDGGATNFDQCENQHDSASTHKRQDNNYCFYEENEMDGEDAPRKKTAIEEQWEKNQEFELTSVEQETYEKYFYGTVHWNYFTSDDDLGPVILSIKQESLTGRDHFRILVRGLNYTIHGLIPASCVFADRYNREEVVRSLGKEVNITPPFMLAQLPGTTDELLKLDKAFIKADLKVGVIYVREGQYTEEEILDNNESSPLFDEFLQVLGEKVRLQGFDKYKGGLDTVHDLTGHYSVYTKWRGIDIMFHVSTLLPYEKNDAQKLQRKRHIGNDIVCVVFLEADKTHFSPACIKSHFLHTFIVVQASPRQKRKVTRYAVSVVTRDEVGAYKPYLWEQNVFDNGPMFREWILTKIVNGERASYSAPKFAGIQERTRSQLLEDIVSNLVNHAETGEIPRPYRRGSWRPGGHTIRPSSPLLDSFRERFEDVDQLAKDFSRVFLNNQKNIAINANLFDVAFLVPDEQKEKVKFIGVRAILATRSRVFKEMLYGITEGPRTPQVPVPELLARPTPTLLSPQKPRSSNFLQVPEVENPRPKSVPSSPMVKRAFSRLGTITASWGRSIRKHSTAQNEERKRWASSQDCSNKDSKEKEKQLQQLALPRLSVCADLHKVDRTKLAQTEFDIIEFDPETVRMLLDYLHTGSCPLSCVNVPGLISAAEHYELTDLLHACYHHAKQFLHIDVVCVMLCSLENYQWRYTSALELVNTILAFIETKAYQLFHNPDFLSLSESMVHLIMARELEVEEIEKFMVILKWAENRVKAISDPDRAKMEFQSIMQRMSKDLKLSRIKPEDLITIVLPSKTIENERILKILMEQADTGRFRNFDLKDVHACRKKVQNQESID